MNPAFAPPPDSTRDETRKTKARPRPITYDVTITVRGNGGVMKAKLMKIPREKIFEAGYPDVIRKAIKAHEYFIAD